MSNKKQPRFTALYAAPAFSGGLRPGKDGGEGNDYPNNYDEPEKPVTGRVYDAPRPPRDGKPEAEAAPEPAPFVCVYAGPDWFASRRREEEEKAKAEAEEAENKAEPGEAEKQEEPCLMGLVAADPGKNPFTMAPLRPAPNPDTPKYCGHCGSATVPGAYYCINCGAKLAK